MKKTIFYFLAIVIGNVLFIRFYFTQELYRLVAFFALMVLVYAIPKFSNLFAQLFTHNEINSADPIVVKKQHNKSTIITAFVLTLLAGFHIFGYWSYFKYEDEDLSKKGIYTPAIVMDKKLETRTKNLSKYYIYYSYKYNGLIYRHNCLNDTLEKGDTIVVKFSPNNPDHHIIMNKKF